MGWFVYTLFNLKITERYEIIFSTPYIKQCIYQDINFRKMAIFTKFYSNAIIRNRLQDSRLSSSMFGSQFPAEKKRIKSDERKLILHLNVSHSSKSLVSGGARNFLSSLKFPHSVTEMNLWKDENNVKYSLGHSQAKMNILQGVGTSTDEELFNPIYKAANYINSVDIVLISSPMWNYSVPYPLKQFIDTIVQPGINFTDENQSSISHLQGRHLVVFSSAGASYNKDSHVKDFMNPYLGQVFRLMGFDKQEVVFIQGTSSKSREELVQFTEEKSLEAATAINNHYL